RLVVDEGACPAVLALQAPENEVAVTVDPAFGEEAAYRMAGADVEDRRHVALPGTGPDQRGVAAAAQRPRQGGEEDRFAGTGLAGQHRHAGTKIDRETLDQYDVADRQGDEHVSYGLAPSLARRLLFGEGVAHRAAIVDGLSPLLLQEIVGV